MIYKIERKFSMWGYTSSHNILLFRSLLTFDDLYSEGESYTYTIDIEFNGVLYIEVPTKFENATIYIEKNIIPDNLSKYINAKGNKLFTIEINKQKFYIVASSCTIGQSKWFLESRALNPNLNYDHSIILA